MSASGVHDFALFAMSGGAGSAVPYVVQNPDRVNRLVLYGTSPTGPLAARRHASKWRTCSCNSRRPNWAGPRDTRVRNVSHVSPHSGRDVEQARSLTICFGCRPRLRTGLLCCGRSWSRTCALSCLRCAAQHSCCMPARAPCCPLTTVARSLRSFPMRGLSAREPQSHSAEYRTRLGAVREVRSTNFFRLPGRNTAFLR